jgi:hypothetical protein
MLHNWIRWAGFTVGALFILGGLGIAETDRTNLLDAVWSIVIGAGIMIAAILQRSRYRSSSAEVRHDDPGPGGGEAGMIEPRFVPTTEVFVDPTSRRQMRVFVDPRTGERRYRAEG